MHRPLLDLDHEQGVCGSHRTCEASRSRPARSKRGAARTRGTPWASIFSDVDLDDGMSELDERMR